MTPSSTPIPKEIRNASARLTVYFLKKRQGFDDKDEYERILDWLKDISNGIATLDAAYTRLPDSISRERAKVMSDRSLAEHSLPYPSGGGAENEPVDQ